MNDLERCVPPDECLSPFSLKARTSVRLAKSLDFAKWMSRTSRNLDEMNWILDRGNQWARHDILDTSVYRDEEEHHPPALLSLVRYRRQRHDTDRVWEAQVLNGLFDLIVHTGGFHSVINDYEFRILTTSFWCDANFIFKRILYDLSADIDYGIPNQYGQTVWMMLAELQSESSELGFLLAHCFPSIDIDAVDVDGKTPSQLLRMSGPQRRKVALDAYANRWPKGCLGDQGTANSVHEADRTLKILRQAYRTKLPAYKSKQCEYLQLHLFPKQHPWQDIRLIIQNYL